MTRARLELARLAGFARVAGLRPETLASLLLDECIERSLEKLAQIAAWQGVAQELTRFFELFIQLGSSGKLHPQARRRQRLEPRSGKFACLGAGNRRRSRARR